MADVIEELASGEIGTRGQSAEPFILKLIHLGLKALADRALVWVAVLLAGFLTTWSVLHATSDVWRLVITGVYVVTVVWALLIVDVKGHR